MFLFLIEEKFKQLKNDFDIGELRNKGGIYLFKKILVANRGAIAARIIRTLKQMNISVVAIYSEADQHLPYLKLADETFELKGNMAKETYLNQERIIEIVKQSGADGVHPGYGFLAENSEFAKKLEKIDVKFIGPSPEWLVLMADKNQARQIMSNYSMPIGKGSDILSDNEKEVKAAAVKIGYPVLVKPANGGGGIGMLPVYEEEKLLSTIERAKSISQKYFDDNRVYLESYLENPRHIEFQILADKNGNVVHLYERDCSIQRRHQKIIEESPAPNIPAEEIENIAARIQESIQQVGYDNVGTVELLRGQDGNYSFLEMNTRLQVEHAVTEEVIGLDLVKAQIESAANIPLRNILPNKIEKKGHAIEVRVYAEDPLTFFPSPGTLKVYYLPEVEHVRVETGFEEGNVISPFYDPMIAKIIVHDATREKCIERLCYYLKQVKIEGVKTNLSFLIYTLNSPEFRAGDLSTNLTMKLVKRMKDEMNSK